MATYLVRCAESGREQQARLGKLRRDLAEVIAERVPGARIEMAPGRLIVEVRDEADGGVAAVIAGMPGVGSVSRCERVAFDELAAAVVRVAQRAVLADGVAADGVARPKTFAIRIRRGGEKSGASAGERRPDIARRLAAAVIGATSARIDLTAPDLEIGIELRGDEAFVFDCVVDGIDRTGPALPSLLPDGEPRFVADQMLGRLAARLRLLGYDTLTVFDIADSEVTRMAAADGRILLTRDGPLAATRAVPVVRLHTNTAVDQLTEVMAALSLSPDPARYFTRCTLCNTLVVRVEEASVREQLPISVRDRGLAVFRCPGCAQLYWRGSHVERVLSQLPR